MSERLPIRILPFRDDSSDWRRFESFCLASVRALPEVERAARYGDPGDKQMGIDIEADLVDGRKRTVQCRHRKRFFEADAKKTVADTEYEADEHEIWVTCNVGKKVSDYVEGHFWALVLFPGVGRGVASPAVTVKHRLGSHGGTRVVIGGCAGVLRMLDCAGRLR